MIFNNYTSLRENRRYRGKKGATLFVTVLVAVIAATIATFTIRFILSSMSNEYERYSLDQNSYLMKNIRAKVLTQLDADPFIIYSKVLEEESPRMCLTTDAIIEPGSSWPDYCGLGWTYPTDNQLSSLNKSSLIKDMKVQIFPYNFKSNYPTGSLILRIKNTFKNSTYGLEDVLLPGGRERSGVYSASDLNLGLLQGGSYVSKIDSNVYSMGNITLSNSTNITNAFIKSEEAITPTPSSTSAYYASKSPNISSNPKIYDINSFNNVYFTKDSLRSLSNSLNILACPSDMSVNPKNLVVNSKNYSTYLCLKNGGKYIDSSNNIGTLSSGIQSILILPEVTSNTIDIYTSSQEYDPDSTPSDLKSSCATDCSTNARTYVSSGTHFGSINYWSKLGTFYYPLSGLLGSNLTTEIGLCDGSVNGINVTGFLSQSGSCAKWSNSLEGIEIKNPLTIVVGSSSSPVDLYIGGPINSIGANKLGAVVSGDTIIPYWSRPMSSSYILNLDISLAVIGRSSSNPIRSYPSYSLSSYKNSGIKLNGYFGSTKLTLSEISNISSNFYIDTSSLDKNNIPPFFALPNLYWYSDYSRRIDPQTLSGM